MSYPSIADHGLIGDVQTAALVAADGTIDSFCCPRFDSPRVFASLLDDRKGGRFALAPVTDLAPWARERDARLTFTKMLTYANHLGVYSEEIDAVRLDPRLDHPSGSTSVREGRARRG